jgi:hypothetical protein
MKCKLCNETDSSKFYSYSKIKCKKCCSAAANERYHKLSEHDKNIFKQWQDDNILLYRFRSAKSRAIRKKIDFTITEEDIQSIYDIQCGKCFYTGNVMTMGRDDYIYSVSIDRIDSTQGYTLHNVVLCCSAINYMKRKLDIPSFMTMCTNVVDYNTSKI